MGVPHISNRSERQSGGSRRGGPGAGLLAVLGAVPAAAVLTGCGGGSADASEGASQGASQAAKATTSAQAATRKAAVTVTPADGTKKAGFTSPVEVTVTDGTLTSVKVTGNDGSTLSRLLQRRPDSVDLRREPVLGHQVQVMATTEGGTEETATFTTKSPGETFVGYFTPEANSTSGVGMPVSINFTHAVTDRAAVEKAITVTA